MMYGKKMKKTDNETYDKTMNAKKLKKSYFGKFRVKKPFVREEIDRFADS